MSPQTLRLSSNAGRLLDYAGGGTPCRRETVGYSRGCMGCYSVRRMAAATTVIYVVRVDQSPRWRISTAAAVDAALVVGAAAAELVGTHLAGRTADGRPLDTAGSALLVASAAVLALRRSHPIATLIATAAIGYGYDALDYPAAFYTIPLALALFTAAAEGKRVQAVLVIAVAFAAFVTTDALFQRGHILDAVGTLWFGGWLAVSFVTGEVFRARRAYLEEVESRAIEAERTREEEARRRASEERMRIARELHDVLAHSISVINVQAGVALHLLDRQPERARPALVAITEASRDALRDLRATLGVLRGLDDEEPRAPAPTLARLDDLVTQASAAGAHVRVNVTGGPRPLPPDVDLAAYRIAQESLTNVARHARPPTATLSIAYGLDELVLEVEDEGGGTPDARAVRSGHGLIGMRERAASAGGELEAGPRPQGGFRVRVRLPLDGAA
jgi:signal transduction histidine kinase